MKKTLVLQGGGFRTAFTAGVLDSFLSVNYNPFEAYIAVSGGAIALSYFLSEQQKKYYDAMCLMSNDKEFMNFNRVVSANAVMNVDYLFEVAERIIPFDKTKAIENSSNKSIQMVTTSRLTGQAQYMKPDFKNWMDVVIASCTLPFITKGEHVVDGIPMMDGGWSDPIPVLQAYKNGAKEIVVIRTSPSSAKVNQSWSDYFGSLVYRSKPKLKRCFEEIHEVYNSAIDFIQNPPQDLIIHEIAPELSLQTGTYSNSIPLITSDYDLGFEYGEKFISSLNKQAS